MECQRPAALADNPNRRSKSSSVLKSFMLPKTSNRMSREIVYDKGIRERNSNVQTVPILPADHPHSSAHGSENVAPTVKEDQRQSRGRDRADDKNMQKRSKSAVSLRSLVGGDDKKSKSKPEKVAGQSPEKKSKKEKKMVKTKSSTGLSSMFARMNKSSKNLAEYAPEEKENASTPSSASGSVHAPIWSEFSSQPEHENAYKNPKVRPDISDADLRNVKDEIDRYTPKDYSPMEQRNFQAYKPTLGRPGSSGRPKSAIFSGSAPLTDVLGRRFSVDRNTLSSRGSESSRIGARDEGRPGSTSSAVRPGSKGSINEARKVSSSSAEQARPRKGLTVSKRGARVMAAVAAFDGKAHDAAEQQTRETKLDPQAVDAAFEAVLEVRNIPEEQRRKMRTLTLHVKADFVKQENSVSRPSSPIKQSDAPAPAPMTGGVDDSATAQSNADGQADTSDSKSDSKRSRPRSRAFTFSKGDLSPGKKQKGASRPTSMYGAETVATSPRKASAPETSSSPVRKTKKAAFPEEFVDYLRKERDPVQTEVGRLHKLRLLLRNETVAWVDEFIKQGGMTEIVDLLHRIMAIEWREDHEDHLLHETLLCLKGLCTTTIALQRLDEVADALFPNLLSMLFDEERKGPAEFTTRGVMISVLFAYLNAQSTASPETLETRAQKILGYLRDPEKTNDAQPLAFVLDMHERRPYRIWGKEVSNVSKEVFWIFLHHLNVIPSPDKGSRDTTATIDTTSYTTRNFPTSRPPVPAAPYIGGVEWDATTYITAHLDLLNGLIAALPSRKARNTLRNELLASGWEKTMGGTLRTCKEKFYCSVHDALRLWVQAAEEDGWDTSFVRQGPSREERVEAALRSSPKKSPAKKEEAGVPRLEAPRMELPALSLGFGGGGEDRGDVGGGVERDEGDDGWLM